MTESGGLLAILSLIATCVQRELGGKVTFSKDKKGKAVILHWEKYGEASRKTLEFDYKLSFVMIKSAKNPVAIGQVIVDKYRKKEKNDSQAKRPPTSSSTE